MRPPIFKLKKGSKPMAKAKKKKAKEPESQSECLGYLRELQKLQDAVLRRMDFRFRGNNKGAAGKDNHGKGK